MHKTSKFNSPQASPKLTPLEQPSFIPMSRKEMRELGWEELDILLISGDAYIDAPSFAMPLLARHLIANGFRVGLICQPSWQNINDLTKLGPARLFAGISAGAIDSMLAHYTAFKKIRRDDAYTPGGKAGRRPNRATSVYSKLLRQAFPDLTLVAGGIEASLRRLSHYDFWSDSLHKSLLCDSDVDLLIYGMGERQILDLANSAHEALELIGDPSYLRSYIKDAGVWEDIRGVAYLKDQFNLAPNFQTLPSHQDILKDKTKLIDLAISMERELHLGEKTLVQANSAQQYVYVTPPAEILNEREIDALYALPYTRLAHPSYKEKIPALEMMVSSITSHRGCGSACTFCSLAMHQGRKISSRSAQSIQAEAIQIASLAHFNGSISDVGGPTANMWGAKCTLGSEKCLRESCLYPKICKKFQVKQERYIDLLRDLREIPKIKHIRISSGIRFDLALQNKNALDAYTGEFTGGQLKVAPEHCSDKVLELMRKPKIADFEQFLDSFYKQSHAVNKEQYVVPYLISAFPGTTNAQMYELATWLEKRHWSPKQVQCFIPTPSTLATAMYYAECDPKKQKIFVAKSPEQRRLQHDIMMANIYKE